MSSPRALIHIDQWPEPVPAGRGTILDAALKAGVPFPHACRAGECGQCKCRLVRGEIEHDACSPEALTSEERSGGLMLACRARARGDVEVTWLAPTAPSRPPQRRHHAEVLDLSPATHDIVKLRLRLEGTPMAFQPGQFAYLSFGGLPSRAYSMANRSGASELEFHIRKVAGGQVSNHVATTVRAGDQVVVDGPCGQAHLQPDATGPAILVAGGSGLAPNISILRTLLAGDSARPIHLYHGVRDERDLYETEWLQALANERRIVYRPVLSQPAAATPHATGLVHSALERDFRSFADSCVHVCGPPPMVDAVQRLARTRGACASRIHADAFHAAPAAPRGILARLRQLLPHRA